MHLPSVGLFPYTSLKVGMSLKCAVIFSESFINTKML